jgi:phosphoglycolate phosphatase
MRYKHIIWDWNGTLLDDTQAGVNAINAMLATRSLPQIDTPYYRDVFGFPVINFYRTIGFNIEQEDWDAVAHEFHDLFLSDDSIRLHDDAIGALSLIRQTGMSQSVLSASEQSILSAMLESFGIAHYFDGIFGVDNLYGHSKLELGHALLKRLCLPPDTVLMVGDSLHDHEVALSLGVNCLLIAQGHQSSARLAQSGAPVLNSLAELAAWLQASQR